MGNAGAPPGFRAQDRYFPFSRKKKLHLYIHYILNIVFNRTSVGGTGMKTEIKAFDEGEHC